MNEQVIGVLSKKWVIPTVVGAASFGSGLVAGYIWGKRNGDVFAVNLGDVNVPGDKQDENQLVINWEAKPDYNQSDKVQDAMAREGYGSTSAIPKHLIDKAEYVKMMSLERDIQVVEVNEEEIIPWELEEEAELLLEEDELEEAIAEQMHEEIFDNDEENLPEIRNVFENHLGPNWNYEDELSIRTADQPYVISVDEFVADEAGCDQATVTYYQGDDIMADEFDVPMYGFNEMMGPLKFGHGSNDSGVVYIRNEKLGLEWEVLLHNGRFDVEVLGNDVEDAYAKAELKHSVPRFRDE